MEQPAAKADAEQGEGQSVRPDVANASGQRFRLLVEGEPAPWFDQRCDDIARYRLSTVAGRYLVLGFFGSAGDEQGRRMLDLVTRMRSFFDDDKASFFGVSVDPADERRVRNSIPGVRFFWDFDGQVSRLYGAAPIDATAGALFRRQWVVLDPDLRIRMIAPARADGGEIPELAAALQALPPVDRYPGVDVQAPVLTLRDVFEPELCAQLIELHRASGGQESGVMREVDGRTVGVIDHTHKSRRDITIEEAELRSELQRRFSSRVFPQIEKVFQFKVTRMERYIVVCYDAEEEGHFAPHRDNGTSGTAHRRFAVSVNLNADYEGGEIYFPEYGGHALKPPPGGAVVFSCSLLHAVKRMRRGRRFAFLPFLYDEAAAAMREANNERLAENVQAYVRGPAGGDAPGTEIAGR